MPIEPSHVPSSHLLQMFGSTTVSMQMILTPDDSSQSLAAFTAASNDSCFSAVKKPGASISRGTKSLYLSIGSGFLLVQFLCLQVLFDGSWQQVADTFGTADPRTNVGAADFDQSTLDRKLLDLFQRRITYELCQFR